jgi:hypothetical protein
MKRHRPRSLPIPKEPTREDDIDFDLLELDRLAKERQQEIQRRSQLFARLASITSLASLTKKEKRQLAKEAERANMSAKQRFVAHEVQEGAHKTRVLLLSTEEIPLEHEAEQAWGMDKAVPSAWKVLWSIHPWTRKARTLLHGEEVVNFPAVPSRVRRLSFRPETGVWDLGSGPHRSKTDELLEDLISFLRNGVYRLCPWCTAVFIASHGHQKYCTPLCSNRAKEAGRRAKPLRKEYMKDLMRRKRQAMRAAISVGKIRGTLTGNREKS